MALKARKLYEDLYELRLRLQREAALIELVWGHGILSWIAGGTRIVHPMVTTQVQLSFDPDTGAISVEPEALVPHPEIDLLQGLDLRGSTCWLTSVRSSALTRSAPLTSGAAFSTSSCWPRSASMARSPTAVGQPR